MRECTELSGWRGLAAMVRRTGEGGMPSESRVRVFVCILEDFKQMMLDSGIVIFVEPT